MLAIINHHNTFILRIVLFLLPLLFSCSGGGGGSSGSQNSNTPTYSVTTMMLDYGGDPSLLNPTGISVATDGDLYVADTGRNYVRKISSNTVSIILGRGVTTGQQIPTFSTCLNSQLSEPTAVVFDSATNNLYLTESGSATTLIDGTTPILWTRVSNCTAGNDWSYQYGTSPFSAPKGITLDSNKKLFVADTNNNQIGLITQTINGLGLPVGATTNPYAGLSTGFSNPSGIAVSPSGVIYVADTNNCAIRRILISGGASTVSTFAGSNIASCGYADGVGTSARFNHPSGIAIDNNGTLYVADKGNNRVRAIQTDGTVTTIAGNSSSSPIADGIGTGATINAPAGIAVTPTGGTIYITDSENNKIRIITH